MLDAANGGVAPHPSVLKAIRHGIAAGACHKAARADPAQAERWRGLASEQGRLCRAALGHSAPTVSCALARSASVTPNPARSE